VQRILEQVPSENLVVYAVWQRILGNDSVQTAQATAGKVFKDHRVRHFWDPAHTMGFWYKKAGVIEHKDSIVWDAYFLYDNDSQWSTSPSQLVDAGAPVWDVREQLMKSLGSATGSAE